MAAGVSPMKRAILWLCMFLTIKGLRSLLWDSTDHRVQWSEVVVS